MRSIFRLAAAGVCVLGLAACNGQGGVPYGEAEKAPATEGHSAHHHDGPHGGHIVELTEDHTVHGELVIDEEAQLARLYLLGPDLQTPLTASAVTYHAEMGDGEVAFQPAGGGETASEFTVPLAEFPSSDMESLTGQIHVTVDGEELSGSVTHEHDHAHGDGHSHEEGDAHAADSGGEPSAK